MFRMRAAAIAALLSLCPLSGIGAQEATSRGENFSAGKAPAALFASDCTGSGCHKSPQGLGKNVGLGGLAGYLREHYTNSRESAASLARYLSSIPDAKEARTPPAARPGKPAATASNPPSWGEVLGLPSAAPHDSRAARQPPAGRASRAAARPDDEPAAAASPPAPPAPRGRQAGATAAAPTPAAEPEVAPAPAPPPPQQWDIFD